MIGILAWKIIQRFYQFTKTDPDYFSLDQLIHAELIVWWLLSNLHPILYMKLQNNP